jgi:hypothetical protein
MLFPQQHNPVLFIYHFDLLKKKTSAPKILEGNIGCASSPFPPPGEFLLAPCFSFVFARIPTSNQVT